jgi:glycosyltransferase involved in cell wall biosynthesis
MFGWEFPPFISGGLGTACFGLTTSMKKLGTDVHFVLPTFGKHEMTVSEIPLINASEVEIPNRVIINEEIIQKNRRLYEIFSQVTHVDTLLKPYMTEETYQEELLRRKVEEESETKEIKTHQSGHNTKFSFNGSYGPNLKEEVYRLGYVGYSLGLQDDFDLIHAHDWMTYPAGIAAKQSSGKPLVVHVHATEFDRSGEHVNQVVYDIERMGMHMADHIIAVSHRTKKIVTDRYGIHPDKVSVVHNGAIENEDVELNLHRPFKEKMVLFLGRITSQKGPVYFVEAANNVLKKKKNVRFIMAGDGDLMNKMVRRVAELKISDKFHFTGFLRGDALTNIFKISDLFIMPSVSEPFGIVPIEAMRHEVPVIVSKQSGVAEILPDALKVDFWDVELLTKQILDILNNPAKTKKMIKKNNELVKDLSWDKPAERVLEVYERVLS